MGAIIVAMPKHDDSSRISAIIKESGIWEEVFICETASKILQMIENMDISVVVCTRRLRDMGYEELHEYLPASVSMLLLTKDVRTDLFSSNIIILQMPFKTADLANSIRMLLPEGYKRKSRPVARTDGDRLTIDKAKHLLMDRNNMTEPEAYRYLQKNSMDMGRTLSETAHMILTMNGG
ncbi:MAG: ANTAR domain-containing protein [Lachnospiraceae bacterium]|nr:ANTAR domain-containing protein [Lachnospiraceae bacterium]